MLDQKVLSFIDSNSLFAAGETVVVGVSGGPDSVCLIHLLSRLRAKLGVQLHAAHLNHMLRGREAEVEADYVRGLSENLGIPFTIETRDVRAYRQQHRLSEEEAAREVRYAFLAERADRLGGARVAVGHTADDQAETVLMHIVRGTGLAGLQGMDVRSNLRLPRLGRKLTIVRPLLGVYRAETEDYCEKHSLTPHYDATNYSPAFLRNRIRAELVPLLQSYNPTVKAAILRLASLVREDVGYIDQQVSTIWPQVATVESGLAVLHTGKLVSLPLSLQRHLLRKGAASVLGDVVDIEAVHIEDMRKALAKPVGTRISLPRGLIFQIGYDACFIGREPLDSPPWPPLEREHLLRLPGETEVASWRVRTRILTTEAAAEHTQSPWHAHLDLAATGSSLAVRGRRPGDRFWPLGMVELKKLQDFMVDAKIPRPWRDSIPLLVSPSQIVWVVGWRIDERVKVGAATETVLCVCFEPNAREGEENGPAPGPL